MCCTCTARIILVVPVHVQCILQVCMLLHAALSTIRMCKTTEELYSYNVFLPNSLSCYVDSCLLQCAHHSNIVNVLYILHVYTTGTIAWYA